MTILILYQELAFYTVCCVEELANRFNLDIHIIAKPVNPEAPFHFEFKNPRIHLYNRNKMEFRNIQQLVEEIKPGLIYCGGWIDKLYLNIVAANKRNTKTLLGFDNQWNNTLKQNLSVLYGRLFLKPIFDFAFVPGEKQITFARKLGFPAHSIISGAYSADIESFNKIHQKLKPIKKRFVFSGRYYAFKGIQNLWKAFILLQEEHPNDWELWCLGTGDVEPIVHPKIKHFGFVQPADLPDILKETDVFILPSLFEPWGVVVHEFAAAGFPLICSDKVGAATEFLEEGKNGYLFESGNTLQLKELMWRFVQMKEDDILKMGEKSHLLAQKITPVTWANSLYSILK